MRKSKLKYNQEVHAMIYRIQDYENNKYHLLRN